MRIGIDLDGVIAHRGNPMEGAFRALETWKADGHVSYLITERSEDEIAPTEVWLEDNFAHMFEGVQYTNFFLSENVPKVRKKSEICSSLGIEVMIEDNLETALDCARAGIDKVFLFDRPWNQSASLPSGVERVFSWEEIIAKL